jgi:hypothetical protein
MLDKLTVEDFAPAVGQPFTLDLDGNGTIDLALTAAATHDPGAGPTDAAGERSPFTLTFKGPEEPLLPQRIYRVAHDAVGALEIFIVPIARDSGGTTYEAIFA